MTNEELEELVRRRLEDCEDWFEYTVDEVEWTSTSYNHQN